MPIKDINELLNMTLTNEKRKGKIRQQVQDNIHNSSSMKQVVPPLHRGDFLESWKEDRKSLERERAEKEKVIQENKKLKKIMNTTYSNTWGQYVETTKKK